MLYLLDTGIVLHLIRKSSLAQRIREDFRVFNQPQRPIISVVTMGELYSLAIQNRWGQAKRDALQQYFREFLIADIRVQSIILRYAEIDAYSQGKLPEKPLTNSARNMGKNDLWIAATASVLDAQLLTLDSDFDHLDSLFLDLKKV